MSEQPFDWFGFFIRFACASVFFGVLFAALLMRFADSAGFPLVVTIWTALTIFIGIYAARAGDEAWRRIANVLMWW